MTIPFFSQWQQSFKLSSFMCMEYMCVCKNNTQLSYVVQYYTRLLYVLYYAMQMFDKTKTPRFIDYLFNVGYANCAPPFNKLIYTSAAISVEQYYQN